MSDLKREMNPPLDLARLDLLESLIGSEFVDELTLDGDYARQMIALCRKQLAAPAEPEQAGKALATLVVHLLEGAKLTPKAYDRLPRVYELIRLIGLEGEPVGAAEAGKAQGWVSAEERLVGAIAYLAAEIGKYPHERAAPSRIKRAKELLESLLPAPPTKDAPNG